MMVELDDAQDDQDTEESRQDVNEGNDCQREQGH
jgi:hypothetical protein